MPHIGLLQHGPSLPSPGLAPPLGGVLPPAAGSTGGTGSTRSSQEEARSRIVVEHPVSQT